MKSPVQAFRRSAMAAVLAFTLSVSAVPASFAQSVPTPKIIEYKLPTGQMLYIKEDHTQPIVTIDTWVKTGSVNETAQINGVSHFLEHLLFKGTQTYKVGEIDRLLESRGAEFNAATSDDFTHYYITTATPYWEEAFKLHADMLVNDTITEAELTRERKVVQEEINRATDNPDRQMFMQLGQMLYGTHGYALDTLGPKANIANIPRQDILDYYHYWYQPKNFNTIIVGDVDPEQVKKVVSAAFTAPVYSVTAGYTVPTIAKPLGPAKPQARALTDPNISQDYFSLAMLGPGVESARDTYAMDIAMMSLGSGKSSRLYRALREERNLVNSLSAGNYTQKYSGLLYVSAEMKPENRDVVKQEIMRQLVELRDKGITPAELRKAKTQYLNDFIFQNETTDGVAQSLGYNVTIGTLQDYLDHVKNVESVTLAQVQDALKRYIDFNHAVIVEEVPQADKNLLKQVTAQDVALLQNQVAVDSHTTVITETPGPDAPEQASVNRTVLANGITLLSKPVTDSATVAIKVLVKGGQGVESIPGTASLTASTLMQGTTTRSVEQINQALESRGMNLTASTSEDYLEVTGTAVAKDLPDLFVILKDVLENPAFAQGEVDKKKDQLKQAIVSNRDNPSGIVFENLSLKIYPMHPYGDVGKRVEDHLHLIQRDTLTGYYRDQFRPENMIVTVVGNFDADTVRHDVENLTFNHAAAPAADTTASMTATSSTRQTATTVGPEPAGSVSTTTTTSTAGMTEARSSEIPPVPPLTAPQLSEVVKAQLGATWLAQGWLVPPLAETKDYVALKVLNSLLGSGMSSRLFVDLREKQGLAYVVGSFYPTRKQASQFVLYIGTDPVNTDKVKLGFDQEIKRLQTEPVSENELSEAKSKLIGAYALAHDTNTSQAFYLGMYEALGAGYGFDQDYPKLVEQVTAADIQRVANTWFAKPSVVSLIKPANMKSSGK